MKTRIIHTKFWRDEKIQNLKTKTRYFYLYLLSCPYIEMTGIFEININYTKLETGLTTEQIKEAKKELEKYSRAFFYNDWVYIPRVDKFNKYSQGEKTGVAYKKELLGLPKKVVETFHNRYPIDTLSIPYRYSSDTHRNNNKEIINNKTENLNNKTERRNKRDKLMEEIKKKHDFLNS